MASHSTRHTLTVLVVDDLGPLRSLVCNFLEDRGYRVLAAKNATEAMKVSEEYADCIDVLVTDVQMPGMNGVGLAQSLKTQRPEMRTILMSGYPGEDFDRDCLAELRAVFLWKPFSKNELFDAIGAVLRNKIV